MLKLVFVVMIAIVFIPLSASAISAQSAILIDSVSGRVLYEYNANEKLPMASTTKIMTGLLACESERLKECVKVSPFASVTEGSSLWLKAGEKQTLENLTYGLMLKSGNDAAVAIAEHLGGSVDAFALMMNKRAKEIGAVNTNFENPHGLDSKEHYTTAYDLALIAREAMKNENFRKIVSTKTYSIPTEGEKWDRVVKNHNKLLWTYSGCNGIKTGYTKKSGRCLVSSVALNEQEFICVTLNAPDDWNDHKNLFDYGFDNFTKKTIAEKDRVACTYKFDEKNSRSVNLVYGDNFSVPIKESDIITTQIELKKLIPPIKKGTEAGALKVFCNGKKLAEIPLLTMKKIDKISIYAKLINFITDLFKK